MVGVPNFKPTRKMENAEQHRDYPVAYSPIPKDIVKKEPATSEEDDEECELVTYSPLPHSDIKEESEIGDDYVEFKSAIPVTNCSLVLFSNFYH